jgi:hypothetical protein
MWSPEFKSHCLTKNIELRYGSFSPTFLKRLGRSGISHWIVDRTVQMKSSGPGSVIARDFLNYEFNFYIWVTGLFKSSISYWVDYTRLYFLVITPFSSKSLKIRVVSCCIPSFPLNVWRVFWDQVFLCISGWRSTHYMCPTGLSAVILLLSSP